MLKVGLTCRFHLLHKKKSRRGLQFEVVVGDSALRNTSIFNDIIY